MTSSDDAGLDQLAEDLRRSVSGFVRAIRRQSGTARTAQTETLDLLERGGPLNVAALAAGRGVTHQTMRLIVAQLDAAGMLTASNNPSDRRSRLYALSISGAATLALERTLRSALIRDRLRTRVSLGERRRLADAVAVLDLLSAEQSDPER